MFLKIAGYGLAAVGALGGYTNFKKLQADVGESNAARAVLKLDPTGLVAKQPTVIANAKQLDDDITADKHAVLIDAGLIALGLFIAHRQ